MSVTKDSVFNNCAIISIVDSAGIPVENEHLDLPYGRELIVNSQELGSAHIYKVRASDHWSNIAARAYRGRSDFWRIIAEWSGVEDPFEELVVGKDLVVPAFDVIMFDLLRFDPTAKGRPSDKDVD